MTQNTSSAVMAQRKSGDGEPDFYITPPWATRALFRHVPFMCRQMSDLSCLEPACGNGRMANTLAEYFGTVAASDKYDYGFGTPLMDFLDHREMIEDYDFIITNPPFRLGEKFINKALPIAQVGVAMLVRTVFIESIRRYDRLFRYRPPTYMAQFCERVPMVKGRLSRTATTATGYAWLVWDKSDTGGQTRVLWIPKCRKALEREEDYE